MPRRPTGRIVAGVDGSPSSLQALEWAAREAQQRDVTLRIVHALHVMLFKVPFGVLAPSPIDPQAEDDGRTLLAEAEKRVRDWHPEVRVETALVVGPATQALVDAAAEADLVVVGSRGLSGVGAAFVGSVGVELAAHAACPVVVLPPVRERPEDDGLAGCDPALTEVVCGPRAKAPIVVGVDGSRPSRSALRFAVVEAALTGRGLVAVNAWQRPAQADSLVAPPADPAIEVDAAQLAEGSRALLERSLAPWREIYPRTRFEERAVDGHPAQVLLDAAREASLLVLGSRGRGGFTGLLFGSISQAVLHRAEAPVAVIRVSTEAR
ncbi:universal stress protein [Allonocardiopsis opalescens]|uniref:Nucleotide-binding universal stress UspA family protein n=1 Tax=Allonocardiopsis opalescens TaxID=1144618 RepID=A0A2T0Q9C8_9ACTN|nr:universal stress protein [Allonocardiopsis opalescens]PRY00410.1 nucleotide-binding universal stress UspA family protein [Allonocardiopsis opalescens]